MRRLALAATVSCLVAACASDRGAEPETEAPPPPVEAAPPPPVAVSPPPISIPPAQPDQCGAYELQGLVGRPRTEIPVPVNPSRRRVVCESCPRTLDFNPLRLTIEYDAATNLVTSVSCG